MISGGNIALLTALLIVQSVHIQSLSSVNYGRKGFNFPDDPQPQPQDPNVFDQQMPEDGIKLKKRYNIFHLFFDVSYRSSPTSHISSIAIHGSRISRAYNAISYCASI